MKRIRISQTSPITESNSSFPIFARFYNSSEGNLLRYKDGAIPFFIKISDYADNEFVLDLKDNVDRSVRIAKGFVFDKFTVYELSDYGYQSLSPTFEDVTFFIFKTTGYKLPEKDVVLIKNYTMKKVYLLIPKTIYSGDVIGYTEPSNKVVREFSLGTPAEFTNGVVSFSLDDYKLNNINNIELYVKESGSEVVNYLPRSEYSFTVVETGDLDPNVSHKFIENQDSYFFDVSKNQLTKDKIYSHYQIELNNDLLLTSSEVYIVSKEYYKQFYYGLITTSRSIKIEEGLDASPRYDVYRNDTNGMVKLVEGFDYYLTDLDTIKFSSDLGVDTIVEVYIKKDPKFHIAFDTGSSYDHSTSAFNPKKALYDSYIKNWNVVPASSFVNIFEEGLYKGDHSYTILASKSYEYVIEDISYEANSSTAPTGNTTVTLKTYPVYSESDKVNIKTYQITTDPGFNAIGNEKESNTQEVYLYDKGQNFNVHASEPYVENDSSIIIQGIADPYPDLLPTVRDNYQDFQSVYESGKTKLTKTLHDNTYVQSIETQISQLKKNFNAILENSEVTYTNYSQAVSAGQFIFLVLTGTAGQHFTLAYKDESDIIKKEYNCTFDSNGRYISIPFFFDTFNNSEQSISFEVLEGTVTQYHIYK